MPDTVRSISTPGVHSQTVVNPDGSNIGDALPTSGNNPQVVWTGLSSAGDNLTKTVTINGVDYIRTFVYTGTGPYTLTISTYSTS
jgi:hypothetical protein